MLLKLTKLRIKLILSNKVNIIFIIMMLLFSLLLYGFNDYKEENDRIPITIIDNDKTELSEELIENISDDELLKVYDYNFNKSMNYLKAGRIEGVL